jgi:hypothetical protein
LVMDSTRTSWKTIGRFMQQQSKGAEAKPTAV